MYTSDLIIDFLEHLEIEQNRSQKTIENYHHYLNRFVEFAGDLEIDKISSETVRKWRLWLNRIKNEQGEQISRTTQNYHLIALRSFLKYCAKRDIKTLSADKIELARVVRKQVTFLSPDELERILAQPNTGEETGLRDRAILELLFSSGLRVSELVGLDREHINLKRREFTVRGKGQKDRPVFISDQAAYWIMSYIKQRKDNMKPLFIRYSGAQEKTHSGDFMRLTARSIQRVVKKYALMAGVTKKVSPHTLRHSFATDLIMNGADIRSVQSMLGHSNIATTQIYTHITDPHLKDVHKKHHRKSAA